MKLTPPLITVIFALFIAGNFRAQTTDTTEKKAETHVEVMPEYPGGVQELVNFIGSNIKYPKSARNNGISGKCFVKFIVTAEGNIGDVTVLKGVAGCPECDEEAVRVIKLMPRWKPGYIDNKAVPVYYNIPINFTLTNKK